jgi:hypothetical protein
MRGNFGTALRFARFVSPALFALAVLLHGGRASAAGSFKFKSTSANEVSGAWHVFVTIQLPRAPATAHVPLKFLFTKEVVFERALIDNHADPVTNATVLSNQTPSVESLDVDFADGSGKIFKGTRFDFSLTRDRGYEAGEYKVQVRTSDGIDVGSPQKLTLNGDNPVVDRRSITFSAKDKSVKKVDDVSGQSNGPPKQDNAEDTTSTQSSEVQATGTEKPFIPAEAYNKQPEEEVKTHPSGCGCVVAGARGEGSLGALGAGLGLALLGVRRRTRRDRAA